MQTKNNCSFKNQKNFIEHFEETYGDSVIHIELAELICNEETLKETGLENSNRAANIQGLFLFCGNEIYFYIPSSVSMISAMMNRDSFREPKDECTCLTKLSGLELEFPMKKKFAFLFPENSRTLHGVFTGTSGSPQKINFFFINPVEKFRNFFAENRYSCIVKTNE